MMMMRGPGSRSSGSGSLMMMMRRSGCSLMMMVMIKVLIGALLCKNYATGELTFRRSPLGPDTSGLHSGLSLLNIHSGEWGWKNGKRLQPLAEKQQRVQPELVRCIGAGRSQLHCAQRASSRSAMARRRPGGPATVFSWCFRMSLSTLVGQALTLPSLSTLVGQDCQLLDQFHHGLERRESDCIQLSSSAPDPGCSI